MIDDVGLQDDLPPGVPPPPKQSEAAFSGGTLIDLGLVGADDDQLAQMFTVGGLSTENFVVYDSIAAEVTAERRDRHGARAGCSASSRCSRRAPRRDRVQRRAVGDPFVTIETTVDEPRLRHRPCQLGGFLDVFIWTDRALLPFSPLPAAASTTRCSTSRTRPPRSSSRCSRPRRRTIRPEDGINDPETLAPSGEVSYGTPRREASSIATGTARAALLQRAREQPVRHLDHHITAMGNAPLSLGDSCRGGRHLHPPDLRRRAQRRRERREPDDPRARGAGGFETGTHLGQRRRCGRSRRGGERRRDAHRRPGRSPGFDDRRAGDTVADRRERRLLRRGAARRAPTSSRSARPSATRSSSPASP